MTKEEYGLLFEKYLAGQASPDEVSRLMAYQDDFELEPPARSGQGEEQEAAGRRIRNKIRRSTVPSPWQRTRTVWWAAAVLTGLVAGVFLFKHAGPRTAPAIARQTPSTSPDIVPGSSKAMLALGDGRTLFVNDMRDHTSISLGNISIAKEKNGVLRYRASGPSTGAAAGLNTLSTPRGGEYQLMLPDGTRVWLNAASSLTFDPSFPGKERRVTLTGEGYFEVAKNKHKPFRVKFNDQEVEVLGTHFNIMAYPDEPTARTTLLEGSVKISRNRSRQILVPGEQAVSTPAATGFNVLQVDLREVMAWKNGYLAFRNATIYSIMQQAARWYDVEVVYQEDLNGKIFGGRISRYSNISELLHNLELTGTIHFKTEGRRVIVMP